MARDHFIAQTYLKHFGDAKLGGMLHVYRKSDSPAYFRCWPQDVCYQWDDDLNPEFLPHRPELLGDFRKMCEPNWDISIESLLSREKIPDTDRFVISAYFANLMTCTPAWRRVGVEIYNRHLAGDLLFAKKMKEKHGGQTDLPVEAIEMMERGEKTISTNPAKIKAVVTRHLLEHACMMYNQDWTVLNNDTDQPFITSDNPVAIMYSGKTGERVTRFLPITPRLCLSVTYAMSRINLKNPKDHLFDFLKPSHGKTTYENVNSVGARNINRVVAMCGEEIVFSSMAQRGVEGLVKRYADYGIYAEYIESHVDSEDSINQGSIIRVGKRS
jgi:Protein of unknown function (DUF4238)